jgi:RNA polymerase sigma-32 factor
MRTDAALYLAKARNMPRLDREQEAELLRRFRQTGDRRAMDTVARAYQRTVVGLALKYRHYDVSLGDLVAEGNLGPVRALEKFELERGVRFGTYAAYWMRAQMVDHVIKSRSAGGGTGSGMRSQVFFKIRRERVRVANVLGTGDAAEEALAERLRLSVEQVRGTLQRIDNRDVSMDANANGAETAWHDRLAADANQEEELLNHEFDRSLDMAVNQALGTLDVRERFIARNRIMASDTEALSLTEVGQQFSIPRERARQLEARTKLKLQRAIRNTKCTVVAEWLSESASPRA